MKKTILLIVSIAISTILLAQTPTTFILVRHAEKANDGTKNPPLNMTGQERSINLATMLGKQEIVALYSTPFKRTQETLQPLAKTMNLKVQEYDPYAKEDWLAALYEKHSGQTVVIVGHSNTIPILANALLGSEILTQFDDSDYSNLIIIVGSEMGSGKLVRLSF